MPYRSVDVLHAYSLRREVLSSVHRMIPYRLRDLRLEYRRRRSALFRHGERAGYAFIVDERDTAGSWLEFSLRDYTRQIPYQHLRSRSCNSLR